MGRIAKIEAFPLYTLDAEAVGLAVAIAAKEGLDCPVGVIAEKVTARTGRVIDSSRFTPVVQNRRFRALVDAQIEARLFGEGKQAAISLLISLAKDTGAQPQHRLRAAELILSRTMAPAAADASDPADLDLSEMSPDDLRGVIAATQAELQTRASTIDAPSSAPSVEAGEPSKPNSLFD